MKRRIVNPWTWQERYGFEQAIEIPTPTRTLVCSGQTPNDDEGNVLHVGDMRAQISAAFDNVEIVIREAGWSLSDVVQIRYYTVDIDRFMAETDVLTARMQNAGVQATSTLIGVTRLAFPEALVEIEALAAR